MLVKVLRPFHRDGKVTKLNAEIEVPDGVARELVSMGKVEVVGKSPATSGPLTSKTASGLVKGKDEGDKDVSK